MKENKETPKIKAGCGKEIEVDGILKNKWTCGKYCLRCKVIHYCQSCQETPTIDVCENCGKTKEKHSWGWTTRKWWCNTNHSIEFKPQSKLKEDLGLGDNEKFISREELCNQIENQREDICECGHNKEEHRPYDGDWYEGECIHYTGLGGYCECKKFKLQSKDNIQSSQSGSKMIDNFSVRNSSLASSSSSDTLNFSQLIETIKKGCEKLFEPKHFGITCGERSPLTGNIMLCDTCEITLKAYEKCEEMIKNFIKNNREKGFEIDGYESIEKELLGEGNLGDKR